MLRAAHSFISSSIAMLRHVHITATSQGAHHKSHSHRSFLLLDGNPPFAYLPRRYWLLQHLACSPT